MNIFITGGSGFLGSALVSQLSKSGVNIIAPNSKDANLTIQDSLCKFNTLEFDYIYHLAAWTQAGDFCLKHPGEQWINNQKINTNVLDWWKNHQPQAKFIAMGTSCAYAPDNSLVEENYLEGQPIESLYTYAMTKRMLYVGMKSLNKQFGMKYLCLVPSTLYGPGYHTDGRQMHFIFDLMRKILRGKLYGETVSLWGDGHQKRELVFLDDFVTTAIHLATKSENALINIGSGEEYSIRKFADELCNIVGYDPALIQYDTTRYVGAKSKVLSVDKLNNLWPTRKQTTLAEGLRITLNWFMQHREKLIPKTNPYPEVA